jgi:hypothetical protein
MYKLSQKTVLSDLAKSIPKNKVLQIYKQHKFTPHTIEEVEKLLGYDEPTAWMNCPAYKIPYFNLDGSLSDYYRFRFISDAKDIGTGKHITLIRGNDETKYLQPSGTKAHPYFSPLINWNDVAKNKEQPIYIVEGEKKAICGCYFKMPAIGIGGVWNFGEYSHKVMPRLSNKILALNIKDREVIVVFDNDVHTNEDVKNARLRLMDYLLYEGAIPKYITLPKEADKKIGLDDYLMSSKYGLKKFKKLAIQEMPQSVVLRELNSKFVYIDSISKMLETQDPKVKLFDPKVIKEKARTRGKATLIDETTKYKARTDIVSYWLQWKGRHTCNSLAFKPGEDRHIKNNLKGAEFKYNWNTWTPLNIKPVKGNVKPFLDLVDHVFKNEAQHKKWFLQWCAYPLQHLGTKVLQAVFVFSPLQGTGKSYIGKILTGLYAPHSTTIDSMQLESNYNDWAENMQFVVAEEVSTTDKRIHKDILKIMISRQTFRVEKKYVPSYEIEDYANYYFNSNDATSIHLDLYARRFFVIEAPHEKVPLPLVEELKEWEKSGGYAALMYYFLNQVNCTSYNPTGDAPRTDSFATSQTLSLSDLEDFLQSVKEIPDQILCKNNLPPKFFYSLNEINKLFDPKQQHKHLTNRGLARGLKKMGFHLSKRIYFQKNKKQHAETIYCLRDQELCQDWSNKEMVKDFLSVDILSAGIRLKRS